MEKFCFGIWFNYFIAVAVHYWYMRDAAMAGSLDNVTAFRYVDWILTVPLMCVEFYLILKVAGATKNLMWKLIGLSTVMLVTGYLGETGDSAVMWGTISGLAYFVIAYMIWFGEAKLLLLRLEEMFFKLTNTFAGLY